MLSESELQSVRRQAVDAAKKLYTQHGADGFSLRGIAAELGFSTGGLYRYFKQGHDEILAAVRCDAFRTMIDLLQAAKNQSDEPLEQLNLLADAFFDFSVKRSTEFELLFVYQEGDWNFSPELTQLEQQCWEPLESVLHAGVNQGLLEGDPRVLARAFYTTIVGSLTIWMSGDEDPLLSLDRLRESTFGLLIRGATPLKRLIEQSEPDT